MMETRLPKLDARLAAIASMVRDGVNCADIGTDHGLLLTWLLVSGRIPFGYACDVNEKPLSKAERNLSAYHVKDRAKLILCDGLDGLHEGEAGDIVIAGMGGDLICKILSRAPWVRDPYLRLILQPMTKAERLRVELCRNGFDILRERAVVSNGFPYTVIQAAYTGKPQEVGDLFAWTGHLYGSPDPAAREYVEKMARMIREKVQGMSRSAEDQIALVQYARLLRQLEENEL